ncbi:MAG: NADH-quinone oxidoreductase subunit C [Candidatus Sumerlaeaceae bacterium]|jgi:NADH-quinone oxidoreductase subunit C
MRPERIAEILRSEIASDSVDESDFSGYSPWIRVSLSSLRPVMELLRSHPDLQFDFLQLVTAIDWVTHFEVVYHLWSIPHSHKIAVKVRTDHDNPRVPSVCDLWPSADWHEREQFDLLGVVFEGHPDLRRILCPEDWIGHPLRKDYVQPLEYHGISNVRKIKDDWYPRPDEDAKAIIRKPLDPKSPRPPSQ